MKFCNCSPRNSRDMVSDDSNRSLHSGYPFPSVDERYSSGCTDVLLFTQPQLSSLKPTKTDKKAIHRKIADEPKIWVFL